MLRSDLEHDLVALVGWVGRYKGVPRGEVSERLEKEALRVGGDVELSYCPRVACLIIRRALPSPVA